MNNDILPDVKGTMKVTLTTTAQTLALPPGGGLALLLTNTGSDLAFFATAGNNQVVAAASTGNTNYADTPLVANQPTSFMLRPGDTHISLVSAGNSVVYVTRGVRGPA